MYIDPFIAGVLSTILVESIVVIIYAVWSTRNDRK